MNITAAQVSELREKTGLGMMLCKKALTESNGDMSLAIENLRKQGQATMEKRAGKAAKEGCVAVVADTDIAYLYEVNAETDFVARNADFVKFANDLGALLLAKKPASLEAAKALHADAFGGHTVEEKVVELTGKIGEIIAFRRMHMETCDVSRERIFSYVHFNAKVGILVKVACENPSALTGEPLAQLGKDLAMQVAVNNPIAANREDVPAGVLEKEKEIYLSQAQNSGKPDKVWGKIVEGKVAKFYKDSVLVEQAFIRDPETSVTDRIKQAEKEIGTGITVRSFVRFELGA
jgi:elongation factor Ts